MIEIYKGNQVGSLQDFSFRSWHLVFMLIQNMRIYLIRASEIGGQEIFLDDFESEMSYVTGVTF